MNRNAGIMIAVFAAVSATASTSSEISAIYRQGRREMQEISQRNRQQFQDFCNSLPSMGGGGFAGGFGGGMAMPQQPPAAQFVGAINQALVADMSPMAQQQLMQISQNIGFQSGGNQMAMAQMLLQVAQSMPPADDSMRIATCCFLTAHGLMGEAPLQVLANLQGAIQAADAQGMRWHRTGNFGNTLRQLGL